MKPLNKYYQIFNASTDKIQNAMEPLDTDIYHNKLATIELNKFTSIVEIYDDIVNSWLSMIDKRLAIVIERLSILKAKPKLLQWFYKFEIKKLEDQYERYCKLGGYRYPKKAVTVILDVLKDIVKSSGAEIGLSNIELIEKESTKEKRTYLIEGWHYHVPVWKHNISIEDNYE